MLETDLPQGIWGKHLVVDCHGCDGFKIDNYFNIHMFAQTLVERIKMVAYGEPQIIRFGKDDKEGFTLIQLIETSNINAHFCPSIKMAYIDVFSCKNFDTKIVKATIKEFFKPQLMDAMAIKRKYVVSQNRKIMVEHV